MRVVWHEMRKIWNWRMVGIVVLFGAMFFLALGVQDSFAIPHAAWAARQGVELR